MTHTGHANDMSDHEAWPEIACQRDHETHTAKQVTVRLDVPHGYGDLAQVPARLARRFAMDIWDPSIYPVDGLAYCPAHDAVSATIISHRTWEPRETILALQVCSTAPEGSTMIDMGAQLGWYSLLAASCGLGVAAWEADPENARLLAESAKINGWAPLVYVTQARIGPESEPLKGDVAVRFVKMDLEGAEPDAVRMLWPRIEKGLVDFMQIEVSPVFHDGYPALVNGIIAAGFRAFRLPPKQSPPVRLDDPGVDMLPFRFDHHAPEDIAAMIAGCHQEDIWFQREGASW